MKIIDTHLHIWDLSRADYPWLNGDRSILNQTWKLADVDEEREKAGIAEAVLVQAAGNIEDSNLMLEAASENDWIAGVVCWLPLTNTEETQRLLSERFNGEPFFKGVRHQIHDEADPRWLLQPGVINSLRILAERDIPFDVVAVRPEHIKAALEVADRLPTLRMVFDHLAQPPIPAKERFGEWGALMSEASKHPNFYAKISGLGTASGHFHNRTKEDIAPYIEFALQQFGTGRCFCGGDWPVSMLANSYSGTWQLYRAILGQLLKEPEQELVFSANAARFYNLQ